MFTDTMLQPHQYSAVNTLVETLHNAFTSIKIKISSRSLERVSIMIYEAMSTRNRAYHRIEHCLNAPKNVSALGTIAYLFHDVVYWQIDRARHQGLRQYMSPYGPTEEGTAELDAIDLKNINLNEPGVISRLVFGFDQPATISPADGMNEFLSACIAENILKGVLSPWQMIHIAACIEATIPFRKPAGDVTAPMALRNRLKQIVALLKLKVTDEQIAETVNEAIDIAIHDLSNFAAGDSGLFLKNSWDIIWEANSQLQKETYTVRQFRGALQATEEFFHVLDPRSLFPHTIEYPGHQELTRLWEGSHHNLVIGREYIQAKILAAALVEAVAEETGGDAPIVLFMGRHPVYGLLGLWKELIEDLPFGSDKTTERYEVQLLLQTGRSGGKEKFDVSQSPIAAYLFSNLDDVEFRSALMQARAMFDGKLKPDQFLRGAVQHLVDPVLERISKIALSRREQIEKLRTRLKSKKAA